MRACHLRRGPTFWSVGPGGAYVRVRERVAQAGVIRSRAARGIYGPTTLLSRLLSLPPPAFSAWKASTGPMMEKIECVVVSDAYR